MAENQGFKERLELFIQSENLNNARFERICGFPNATVRNISIQLKEDKIAIIEKMFPQLNIMWLRTGRGEMYRSVMCEDVKPYSLEDTSTPYGSMFDELKVLRQKMEIYEGKIDNYEQERTRMLDTITQLTSIISRLTEEREKLANKNK